MNGPPIKDVRKIWPFLTPQCPHILAVYRQKLTVASAFGKPSPPFGADVLYEWHLSNFQLGTWKFISKIFYEPGLALFDYGLRPCSLTLLWLNKLYIHCHLIILDKTFFVDFQQAVRLSDITVRFVKTVPPNIIEYR